mgnify:CR=1 FL=1
MLKEWTYNYIKHKDIIHRRISEINDLGDYFLVNNKDESHIVFLVKENVSSFNETIVKIKSLEKEHNANKVTLVVYNNKSNFELLVTHWEELVSMPTLIVVFSNPKTNDKWMISPHVHNKIADSGSLKQGLKSMFETVEEFYI